MIRRFANSGRPAQVTPSETPVVRRPVHLHQGVLLCPGPRLRRRRAIPRGAWARFRAPVGRRPMARPDKAAAVAEIVDSFNDSTGAVLTEYRGLTVKQLQELRRALGENANYAVVKNTLTKIAAKEAGVDGFDDLLNGPTAIAFINGDLVEAAKGLRDFAKANPALVDQGWLCRRCLRWTQRRSPRWPISSPARFSWASWRARCSLRSARPSTCSTPRSPRLPDSSAPWRRRRSRTHRSSRAVPASRLPRPQRPPRTPAAEEAPDTGAESTEAPS